MENSEELGEIESLRQNAMQLKEVAEMIQHPGWKIVKKHFQRVVQAVSDQLDIEENFQKIKRLQERKRAYRAMLETVDALCEEHSEAILRLESMELEQQERDQFGL